MYIYFLRRLRDAVRKKRPEKWGTNSWFLHRDNAPEHRSVLIKDFVAKNNVKTLKHPPYSPDLSPDGFYLFPELKSAFKGQFICDATDIIKNAMEELKRLSKNGFHECFYQPYSRWQKYIFARGDHFERNVA